MVEAKGKRAHSKVNEPKIFHACKFNAFQAGDCRGTVSAKEGDLLHREMFENGVWWVWIVFSWSCWKIIVVRGLDWSRLLSDLTGITIHFNIMVITIIFDIMVITICICNTTTTLPLAIMSFFCYKTRGRRLTSFDALFMQHFVFSKPPKTSRPMFCLQNITERS